MNVNLKFYVGLLLRRLPVMMALLIVCSFVGIVAALNLPPTYSTSARLLVEEQQIPEGMVTSTVQSTATEQLSIIEQRLLTRANMIDIANKFNVFEDLRSMNPDEVVEEMRRRSSVKRIGGRDEASFMTVGFQSRNPQIAANVVGEYVTLILEANNDFRMSRAEGTLQFFQQEVDRLSQELDRQSARIVEFKSANEGALPDDLEYRLGRQALLQERLARAERDLEAARSQRQEIVRMFEATGQVKGQVSEDQMSPDERELAERRRELQRLRAIYTESNPRLRILQGQISQLEEAVAAGAAGAGAEGGDQRTTLLNVTLAEIDTRIKGLEEEISMTTAALDRLEKSISATSGNEIQLSALERDFENTQMRYNSTVNNLNQARMGERIEVTSQGQRITVIESANVPREPSGPNRPMIAAMGIAIGLGLAGAYFVLLELLNFTIRRPAEIQSRFGVMPLAAIPYIESRGERFVRRAASVAAILAVLAGVPAGLWYVNANIMPLDLVTAKIISRLGV